jgi:sugar phosphate isomerase/epimerase
MRQLKLAFTNLACPAWRIDQVASEAARLGYDGVELRLLDGEVIDPARDRAALGAAVDTCRSHAIDVCAFDTSCCFNVSGTEQRRQLETLRRWIDRAHALDVPVLRVFGGPDEPGVTPDAGTARVADGLARAAPEAAQAGVTIALETHDAFSSAQRVAQVLDYVGSAAVGALWDSHHPYRVGESADEVAALLDGRLVHVHVKDARRTGSGEWDLVLLGEGEVPVWEQLQALDHMGYDGYVSVEWEKRWNPELADPEIALPQHIAQLRDWMGTA